jgi:hypothetical protein
MSTTQFIGKPVKQSYLCIPDVVYPNLESRIGFIKSYKTINKKTIEDSLRKQQLKRMEEL